MWFMTDDEIALVLALVRQHVAQTARTWVVSHVQVRGKRKREVLTWDGIRTPHLGRMQQLKVVLKCVRM